MAKVSNPRKQFQFNIIIPGINPFLVQEVKTPDIDHDVVEHGDTNFLVKTAGMKKIGTLTISKLAPIIGLDIAIRVWGNEVQNTISGGGQLPDIYKRPIIVEQYAADGLTVVERWTYEGCWPSKINGYDFSRKSSDNSMQTIEFCVDRQI